MNIKISPEELLECTKRISDRSANITGNADKMENAMSTLDSWKSDNKELFFNDLRRKIKDIRAMAEASGSYGAVGTDVANRVIGVESSIRETLLKNQDPE